MNLEDDYEARRERRREEDRNYRADVHYEVWRSGGNPDAIDDDRVADAKSEGLFYEEAAKRELRRMRPKHQEPEPDQEQEQE